MRHLSHPFYVLNEMRTILSLIGLLIDYAES